MKSEKHRHLGTIRGPVAKRCISWSQQIQQRTVIGIDDYMQVGYDTVLAQLFINKKTLFPTLTRNGEGESFSCFG